MSDFVGASYVLPLRRQQVTADPELADYLGWLAKRLEVIVVDGSPAEVFADNDRQWCAAVRHVPVRSECLNGKVAGVVDGVHVATGDLVVVADDDVRYDATSLARVIELAGDADVVRPQNYFDPLPWHARWDTARTLLNRAFGADYPGTVIVRRSTVEAGRGYCGAVLFENLELIRTLRARGARGVTASDVYVRRLPPPVEHFWGQRVRQAYDSLAQPWRLAAELAILPTVAALLSRRATRVLPCGLLLLAIALAEVGRRRHGGQQAFAETAALWAPLWVGERAVCSWLALVQRLRGGAPYAGRRLLRAAHPVQRLAQPGCPEGPRSCTCRLSLP